MSENEELEGEIISYSSEGISSTSDDRIDDSNIRICTGKRIFSPKIEEYEFPISFERIVEEKFVLGGERMLCDLKTDAFYHNHKVEEASLYDIKTNDFLNRNINARSLRLFSFEVLKFLDIRNTRINKLADCLLDLKIKMNETQAKNNLEIPEGQDKNDENNPTEDTNTEVKESKKASNNEIEPRKIYRRLEILSSDYLKRNKEIIEKMNVLRQRLAFVYLEAENQSHFLEKVVSIVINKRIDVRENQPEKHQEIKRKRKF